MNQLARTQTVYLNQTILDAVECIETGDCKSSSWSTSSGAWKAC